MCIKSFCREPRQSDEIKRSNGLSLVGDDDIDTDDMEDQQRMINDDNPDRVYRDRIRRDAENDDGANGSLSPDDDGRHGYNDDMTNPYKDQPTYSPIKIPSDDDGYALEDDSAHERGQKRQADDRYDDDGRAGFRENGENVHHDDEADDSTDHDDGHGENPTQAPTEDSLWMRADYIDENCATLSSKDLAIDPDAPRLTLCKESCPVQDKCVLGCASRGDLTAHGLVEDAESKVAFIYVGGSVKSTLFSAHDEKHKTIYYTYERADNEDHSLQEEHFDAIENGKVVDGTTMAYDIFAATVEYLADIDPTYSC